MPIVDIELVSDTRFTHHSSNHVQAIADRLGDLLEADPGAAWVKLHSLPRDHYAENGGPIPSEVQPVFVTLTLARLPDLDERRRLAAGVSEVVADVLFRRPEHVHVVFQPDGLERVAFGGRLDASE